jgi:Tol biopolymer transport system component/preprotein translocase subunit YajC
MRVMSERWDTKLYSRMRPMFLAASAGLSGASCNSENPAAPEPGQGEIEVTTSTGGAERDQDGYTLQLDAAAAQNIGTAASLRMSQLAPGNHVLQLGGAAANCTVSGENPRQVTLRAGETARVAFDVACRATIGDLQVSSITNGLSLDADGYAVSVDGREEGTLGQDDQVSLSSITPGDHLVGLGGVAGNCQVQGDNPRELTLRAGESVDAAFEVSCDAAPANTGTLRVVTTTTGGDPDPNGFVFTLDDAATQPIAINDTATLENLAEGSHTVALSGIAPNCSLESESPGTAALSAGVTTELAFAVSCSASTGTIQVNVSTTGDAPDPDGYLIQVDGGALEQRAGVNTTLRFEAVAAGEHTVTLGDASSNCRMAEPGERLVTIPAGGSSEVGFLLDCVASTGGIRLLTRTSGRSSSQDGYQVSVDADTVSMRPNDLHVFGGLTPGVHPISVAGLPGDCRLESENPRDVTVTAGLTAELVVTVICSLSGGQIAFLSTRDGNIEIYVMNPDGSNQTRLTSSPEYDHSPAWSPDGRKIAFVSLRDGNDDIYVMNADGSAVTNLTNTTFTEDNPISNAGPAWSPDGTRIAFSSRRDQGNGGIWVMNSDGTDPTQITSEGETAPAWSPDGQKLAFKRMRVGDRGDGTTGSFTDIIVMNADGTDPVRIFSTIISCAMYLEWSPDGSTIAFDGCDYDWSIQLIHPDGTGLTQLLARRHNNEHPTWSPEGRRIAFSSDAGDLVTYSDIYVMNADGTGLTQLTDSPAYDFAPVWSR